MCNALEQNILNDGAGKACAASGSSLSRDEFSMRAFLEPTMLVRVIRHHVAMLGLGPSWQVYYANRPMFCDIDGMLTNIGEAEARWAAVPAIAQAPHDVCFPFEILHLPSVVLL